MPTLTVSLVQLGLLAYFYSDPTSCLIPGSVYLVLVGINSGLLVFLSYRAFQQQRALVAIIAALLAFPGMALLVAVLAF